VSELLPLVPLELGGVELGLVVLGLVGELGLVAEVPEPVVMSLPASAPRARGKVSPRRPSGLAFVPPPPLSLQATPASIAAAEAKVIHFRSVIGMSPLAVRREAGCRIGPSQARSAREPAVRAGAKVRYAACHA
jgi:hypothetical protein